MVHRHPSWVRFARHVGGSLGFDSPCPNVAGETTFSLVHHTYVRVQKHGRELPSIVFDRVLKDGWS
jgi:hypothetical protein